MRSNTTTNARTRPRASRLLVVLAAAWLATALAVGTAVNVQADPETGRRAATTILRP